MGEIAININDHFRSESVDCALRSAVSFLLIGAISTNASLAQEIVAGNAGSARIELRMSSKVKLRTLMEVTKHVTFDRIQVTPSETLDELLIRTYGLANEALRDVFVAANPDSITDSDSGTPYVLQQLPFRDTGLTYAYLPRLPRLSTPKTISVSSGAALSTALAAYVPSLDMRELKILKKRNPNCMALGDAMKNAQGRGNAGSDLSSIVLATDCRIKVPNAVMPLVVELRPQKSPRVVLNILAGLGDHALYADAVPDAVAPPPPDQAQANEEAGSGGNDLDSAKFKWWVPIIGLDKARPEEMELTQLTRIGVFDSGLDLSNPEMHSVAFECPGGSIRVGSYTRPCQGYDFVRGKKDIEDRNSHGTHVSGIAAGILFGLWDLPPDNETIRKNLRVVTLTVADTRTGIDPEIKGGALASALDYAYRSNILRLFNLSLFSNDKDDFGPALNLLQNPQSQVLVVVAAGNGIPVNKEGEQVWVGLNLDTECGGENTIYPACMDAKNASVITVAALKDPVSLTQASNFGPKRVQIAAPGRDILSASAGSVPSDAKPIACADEGRRPCYVVLGGTSQAAAFVTLTAAVLMAKNGSLQPDQVRSRILSTCDHVSALENQVASGCRLNFIKAIAVEEDLIDTQMGLIRADSIEPLTISTETGEQAVDMDSLLRIEGGRQPRTISTRERPDGFAAAIANPVIRYTPKDQDDDCSGPGVKRISESLCEIPISEVKDIVFQLP